MEPRGGSNPDHMTSRDAGSGPIRVMIIDDSITVRTVFSRLVEGDRDMVLAASVSNAERALAKLKTLPVDVILLDLEMPGMGGLEALPKIQTVASEAQVLVVSSLTEDGAEHTMAALSMGAADTMPKPRPGGFDDEYRAALLGKIRALGGRDPEARSACAAEVRKPTVNATRLSSHKRPEVVAFGASTGGIHALNTVLRALPRQFDLPILVTQHLPAAFIPVFARQLELVSARQTNIADDGVEIRPGEITLASGIGHMIVQRRGSALVTGISSAKAPSGCQPSVDPMLESLADALDGHALAVILSGMGRDGVIGAARLVERGGAVFAQDQETSAVWGMPGAVAKAGLTSLVQPPEKLAEAILAEAGVEAWK